MTDFIVYSLVAAAFTSCSGNGIALININQRIILNYGEGYGVTLASTAGVGSEVELTLPIIYDI